MILIALFCLLASIGTEGFVRGKTSPRRQSEAVLPTAVSQSTQEEDSDSSDNVKGFERPNESGSLGVPNEEEEAGTFKNELLCKKC